MGRSKKGPFIASVRIDLMEGGRCIQWIFIGACAWRVIVTG